MSAAPSAFLVALDASSPRPVLAVGAWPPGPQPLAADAWDEGANQTSSILIERIDRCLARAGGGPDQVGAVACGRGPGTFTGTRVALATTQGVALGRGVPLLPLSTLAVLAGSAGANGHVLAALDARRGQVYAGRFHVDPDRGARPLDEPVCAAPDQVFAQIGGPPLSAIVGPGADAYPESIAADLLPHHRPGVLPSPAGLWLAVRSAANRSREPAPDSTLDPAAVTALYLRRSYAELGLNTPKRPVYRSPLLAEDEG